MKLFPAKCPERATLRKLWRQTGNSSLLPAKCWPLLHVISVISVQLKVAWFCLRNPSAFFKICFCFVLLYNKSLNDWSLGKQWILFPSNFNVPSTSSRETLRFSGNKIHCSPRDQSLSVYYFLHRIWKPGVIQWKPSTVSSSPATAFILEHPSLEGETPPAKKRRSVSHRPHESLNEVRLRVIKEQYQ